MTTYRILCFITLCICLVFIFYYPWTVFFLLPLWVAFILLLWKVAMVAVSEPKRAIIFRLEVFHHIARSGYIFLMPGLDRIEREISVAEELLELKVPQFVTADGQRPNCNLEIAWKIRNDVEGRVSDKVRETALMPEERRQKLVEHTLIRMARELALSYNYDQLKDNRIREGFCTTVVQAVNEMLNSHGLVVERIFWRGSFTPPSVLDAQVQTQVAEEEVKAMVKMIKTIRDDLGENISAEDLYAMHEFIKMMRKGGANPFNRSAHQG
ncbi:MAG TPA: SPFH domain-containing protein [Ktedonobacterales bacterium]|jgi:uncharacterized membrane protein YqiK